MKCLNTLLILTAFTINNVYAVDSTSNSVLNTNNNSTSDANSAIGQGSAIGNNTFNSISNNPKQTPGGYSPNLTTSNDTCMGSSSAGLGIPGISVSAGSSWSDKNCIMLKNSRELWNMGQHLASLAMMCSDSNNLEAIELANFVDSNAPHCPQTTKALAQSRINTSTLPNEKVANSTRFSLPLIPKFNRLDTLVDDR